MNPRLWVVLITAGVGGYIVLSLARGTTFLGAGDPVAIGLGLAILVVPLLGIWMVWREIAFGRRLQRLGQALAGEGDLPVDDFPRLPSGRIERDAADAWFARELARVEADRGDWRGWYRLGLAYDAARDRRRAREAMRESIRLAQAPGGPLAAR